MHTLRPIGDALPPHGSGRVDAALANEDGDRLIQAGYCERTGASPRECGGDSR